MAEGNIHVIRNYNKIYPEHEETYGNCFYKVHVEGNIAVITGYVTINRQVPVDTTILTLPFEAAFTVFGIFIKSNGGADPIVAKIPSGSNTLKTDAYPLPSGGVYIFNITVPIQ